MVALNIMSVVQCCNIGPHHSVENFHSAETHPEVVEGGVGDSMPGDVLGQLIQHARVLLRMHTKHRTRNQFPMRSHSKVP